MVTELQYTSIKRLLDNLLDHPMLKDVTLEKAIRYTIRFISLHGYPNLYQEKIEDVPIHEYRGLLPCDLISIIQVKDLKTGICLRAMTDSFPKGMVPHEKHHEPPRDLMNNARKPKPWYIPPGVRHFEEPSFKTQGRVIFTSFPEGCVGISYHALPVDEEGEIQLIDNETYLAALEAYIKMREFNIKFDKGEIAAAVLQNAKSDYATLAGELMSEFTIPSVSEMEAISRELTHLIPRVRQFDNGFRNLGDREWIRRH